jgi:hypothetical protein
MFAGGLLLGATLIGFACWLHWSERVGWPGETCDTDLDREYFQKRTRARHRMNVLIGVSGGLIVFATIASPDRALVWMACWLAVMLILLTVIFLAAGDALRTQRYHAKKLPEIRRKTLGK